MKTALRIPTLEPLRQVLEAVAATKGLQGIETQGQTLGDYPEMEDWLYGLRLPLLSLDAPLPASVSRHLADSAPGLRERLLSHVEQLLDWAAGMETQAVCLDLGLEQRDRLADHLGVCREMLAHLTPLGEMHRLQFCLPIRVPETGDGGAGRLSLSLVEQVLHPSVGIALDVIVDETPPETDVFELMRPYYAHCSLLRFRYEPALGINMSARHHQSWSQALWAHGFRGLVVFAPVLPNLRRLEHELERLAPFLHDFWETPHDVA